MTERAAEQSSEDTPSAGRPTVVLLLLGLAAAVIVVGGMRTASFIVGPIFLALVLTIAVYPANRYVVGRGAPRWAGFLVSLTGGAMIIVVIGGSVVLALARMASLLTDYEDEARDRIESMTNQLDHLGIDSAQQQDLAHAIDPARLAGWVADVLGSLGSLASALFFVLTLLFFMAFDTFEFPRLLDSTKATHLRVVDALTRFAHATRTYLVVSTVFGFIVAVIDTIVLTLLGVPAAGAWGVLAFVTNYIPNIGFVIGLVPPALIGLLDGGPSVMVAVVISYCVVNFVIQSLIQPKFVGDAVGLTGTITFVSLMFWAWVLGAVGALLAVPLTLFARALLVDAHESTAWLRPVLAGRPETRGSR